MKHWRRHVAPKVRARWFACLLFASCEFAHAAACTIPISACSDWLSIAGGTARVRFYRSFALNERNAAIRRALVIVHGFARTANGYFRTALAAAFLAGALEDTIVIAPRFSSNAGRDCHDKLALNELNWICSGPASWSNGGLAAGNAEITSYDIADEILARLARTDVFPNLRSIVIAGHSAGGQFTIRYAMANRSHDRIGIPVRYVVANPSSYTYPDALRPTRSAVPENLATDLPGYAAPPGSAAPGAPFQEFADADKCPSFDNWPYGLRNRVGYSAQIPDAQLVKQLAARPITFLLGGLDIVPRFRFDMSCPAMAQGPTRLARGLAYARYLSEKFGAQHRTQVVATCGHSARCMFTTTRVLRLLFPED